MIFSPADAYDSGHQVTVPCGRCIGCRRDRAKTWALRCMHESQFHENNCFITLTYDDNHNKGSLDKRDLQLFWKKLRKEIDLPIRYYAAGEYGDETKRPHYHACLFGYDFPDKQLWKKLDNTELCVSENLNRIWGKGYCVVGNVTYDSACYVASYINKKILGGSKEELLQHYQGRQPEFSLMSRKPGIGSDWYDKYKETDLFPQDYAIMNEMKVKTPKYYMAKLEKENNGLYLHLKEKRKKENGELTPLYKRLQGALSRIHDCSPERMLSKMKVQKEKMSLKRGKI